MAFHDDTHVITCDAVLLWDGITNPDQDDRSGKMKYNVKLAIPGNAPERQELEQLATNQLNHSEFRGQLPPGGNWPIRDCDTAKLGDEFAGYVEFSIKTTLGPPTILDANGNVLQSMQYSQKLYSGVVVRALTSAYDYNNVQKGIGLSLDGLQIVNDQAPRLAISAGMSPDQIASAFGGGATPTGAAPAGPAPGATPPPAGGGTQVQPNPGAMQPPGNAPAPSAPPAAPPPAPSGGSPGPQMTAAANGVPYDQWIAAGWTDEQLRQNGYMV